MSTVAISSSKSATFFSTWIRKFPIRAPLTALRRKGKCTNFCFLNGDSSCLSPYRKIFQKSKHENVSPLL